MTKDVKKAIALDIINTMLIMNPERHITTSFGKHGIKIVFYYDVEEETMDDDLEWVNNTYGFTGEAKQEFYTTDEGYDFYTIEINIEL